MSDDEVSKLQVFHHGQRSPSWFCGALLRSDGVRLTTVDDERQNFYGSARLIPIGPWHENFGAKFDGMTDGGDLKLTKNVITHLVLPEQVWDEINAGLSLASDMPIRVLSAGDYIRRFQQMAIDWFFSRFPALKLSYVFPVGSNSAGLLTGTVNRAEGFLEGIHVDSWDGVALADRQASRLRLVFNFGPGDRWLLFVPKSLTELGFPHFSEGREVSPSASDLFVSGKITHTWALRIKPGEAYLAATDAIFHDVSTQWATAPN